MDGSVVDEIDDSMVDEIDILAVDEMENMLEDEFNNIPIDNMEKNIGGELLGGVGFEPYEGLEFTSKQAAYDFYNAYGYVLGFSVRENSSYTNKQGIVTSMRLVCSKQGLSKRQKHQLVEPLESCGRSNMKTPQKHVSKKRSDCKASFHVRLHENGIWKVTSFHKEHNHELVKSTPSKKRHFPSHKFIPGEHKKNIELLYKQNVGATKIRDFLGEKEGGKGNLHYGKKDVNNHIASLNRKLVGVDVNAVVDYFKQRQQDDPEFFFAIEPDEYNAARNIFWIDGRSRRAYKEFGDAVTFDTTYNTNKYSMLMAPFLGVNHHQHTIFFGCALIRDEKKTTLFWLFQTWLDSMEGKKPKTFLTDQDPSMRVAIERIFGYDTVHRCCFWHVMTKARDHLGVLYGAVPGFRDELKAVINVSLTVSDFEKNWLGMLEKYKMQDNPHLNYMYDIRDEWVPAYFRGVFCAGMSTTQRSESMNAVVKIWIASNTSLYNFVTRFDKMVEGIYEKESDEDVKTMNETPQMWSCDPIEDEARKVYTRSVFRLFKDKLKRCTAYRVHEVVKNECYEVRPARFQSKYEWYNPIRIVAINKENGRADCECKGFEFQGILCPHALEVMRHVEMVSFLPAHYILKRWTRDANASIKKAISLKAMGIREGEELEFVMLCSLSQLMERVAKKAVKSRPAYEKACARMVELENEVAEINQESMVSDSMVADPMVASSKVQKSLRFSDPPVSQCKGKRNPQRFKRPAEVKDAKRMRTCSYCHKKEGHNMVTCPKRLNDGKTRKVQACDYKEDDDDIDTEDEDEDDQFE